MLQEQTIPKETFRLLKTLMQDKELNDFHLAGGTAIALYLGHRKSIDLDLFSLNDFDNNQLEEHLFEKYNFTTDYKRNNTLKGSIEGVKVDCITLKTKLCEDIQLIESVRLYDLKDIVAMKLLAIADNGTRLKDFIDIAYLSTRFSLNEMVSFASYKFPNKNPIIFTKGLLYYNDIDFSTPIVMLNANYDWKKIEVRINEMAKEPEKVFDKAPLN